MRGMVLTLVLCVTVTAGLAHQGVRNHVVVHRMDLMTAMQDQVKILGDMVRGKTAYDANAATAARAALIALSQDVPARFAPRETDPQSEARATIWTDWPGFVARSEATVAAAVALDVTNLRQGLAAVGRTCTSCHEAYRIDAP